MTRATVLALATILFAAACGDTRGERVATGALGGAAAGQVIAGKPVEGAIAGGLIGAVR